MDKEFNELVEAAQKKYPNAGITGGYIGNCGNNFDDRSWYIFTNTIDWNRGKKFSFGGFSQAKLIEKMKDGTFEKWAENNLGATK